MRSLNFSGAPALILPRSALADWHGILMRSDEREARPDFTDHAGGRWFVHDNFDFDHPVTHYDHLCAALGAGEAVMTIRVGGHDALAISNGDDTYGWWAQKRAIVTNDTEPPSEEVWSRAEWTRRTHVRFDEDELVLMNASVHGAQILEENDASEYEPVTLPAGAYQVESAQLEATFIARLVVRA